MANRSGQAGVGGASATPAVNQGRAGGGFRGPVFWSGLILGTVGSLVPFVSGIALVCFVVFGIIRTVQRRPVAREHWLNALGTFIGILIMAALLIGLTR